MLILSIQHNIYLTREQRYGLHNQLDISITGISIPVWQFENNKTSEPAKEVFCIYNISNPKIDKPIKILKDGFNIYLPNQIPTKNREISNEDWLKMSQEQREIYYTAMPREMSSSSLLDIQDGGSETLIYKETNKVNYNEEIMQIVHYVNMWDIKFLKGSIRCGMV